MKSLTFAALGLLVSTSALAAPIHETWIQSGAPTDEQIASWSTLPGTRSFLFQLDDPTAYELEPLLRLRGADRIRIQVTRFPGQDSLPAYRQLAVRGAEFIGLDAGFPLEDEISRLNSIGFASCVLVSTAFPSDGDGERLSRLTCPTSLTFATRMYPRYMDKESFLELPASMPLLFATDYWPWYSHMDVLNMLPHTQRIRVTDMHAPDEAMQYLLGMRKLDEVQVHSDYDPSTAGYWERFGSLTVRWSIRGPIPSEASLEAFARSRAAGGQRYLIIDQDLPLTRDELSRLERLPIPVEWIHAAPFGSQRF